MKNKLLLGLSPFLFAGCETKESIGFMKNENEFVGNKPEKELELPAANLIKIFDKEVVDTNEGSELIIKILSKRLDEINRHFESLQVINNTEDINNIKSAIEKLNAEGFIHLTLQLKLKKISDKELKNLCEKILDYVSFKRDINKTWTQKYIQTFIHKKNNCNDTLKELDSFLTSFSNADFQIINSFYENFDLNFNQIEKLIETYKGDNKNFSLDQVKHRKHFINFILSENLLYDIKRKIYDFSKKIENDFKETKDCKCKYSSNLKHYEEYHNIVEMHASKLVENQWGCVMQLYSDIANAITLKIKDDKLKKVSIDCDGAFKISSDLPNSERACWLQSFYINALINVIELLNSNKPNEAIKVLQDLKSLAKQSLYAYLDKIDKFHQNLLSIYFLSQKLKNNHSEIIIKINEMSKERFGANAPEVKFVDWSSKDTFKAINEIDFQSDEIKYHSKILLGLSSFPSRKVLTDFLIFMKSVDNFDMFDNSVFDDITNKSYKKGLNSFSDFLVKLKDQSNKLELLRKEIINLDKEINNYRENDSELMSIKKEICNLSNDDNHDDRNRLRKKKKDRIELLNNTDFIKERVKKIENIEGQMSNCYTVFVLDATENVKKLDSFIDYLKIMLHSSYLSYSSPKHHTLKITDLSNFSFNDVISIGCLMNRLFGIKGSFDLSVDNKFNKYCEENIVIESEIFEIEGPKLIMPDYKIKFEISSNNM